MVVFLQVKLLLRRSINRYADGSIIVLPS